MAIISSIFAIVFSLVALSYEYVAFRYIRDESYPRMGWLMSSVAIAAVGAWFFFAGIPAGEDGLLPCIAAGITAVAGMATLMPCVAFVVVLGVEWATPHVVRWVDEVILAPIVDGWMKRNQYEYWDFRDDRPRRFVKGQPPHPAIYPGWREQRNRAAQDNPNTGW